MSIWGKHCSDLSPFWLLSLKRDCQPWNSTAEKNIASNSLTVKAYGTTSGKFSSPKQSRRFTLCSLLGPASVRSADNTGEPQTKGIPGIPLLTDLEKTRLIKYLGPRGLHRGQTITGRIKFTRSYHGGFFMISTTLLRGHVSRMAAAAQGQIKPWT